MSRIQNILDKAEREGGRPPHAGGRRCRVAAAVETAGRPGPLRPEMPRGIARARRQLSLRPAARSRNTPLDPRLVAALSPERRPRRNSTARCARASPTRPRVAGPRDARHQPGPRRRQDPHRRQPRADDGAGLSAADLHRRRGPAALAAAARCSASPTARASPTSWPGACARDALDAPRGSPDHRAPGRPAVGPSGRAPRHRGDAPDDRHAARALRSRHHRRAGGRPARRRRHPGAARRPRRAGRPARRPRRPAIQDAIATIGGTRLLGVVLNEAAG